MRNVLKEVRHVVEGKEFSRACSFYPSCKESQSESLDLENKRLRERV